MERRPAPAHDATTFSRGRVHPREPSYDGQARRHHVWVTDPMNRRGRYPALLLGWRRDEDGWVGRVVVLLPGERGPVLIPDWVPAARLSPA